VGDRLFPGLSLVEEQAGGTGPGNIGRGWQDDVGECFSEQ
jgi:hypothetical protein